MVHYYHLRLNNDLDYLGKVVSATSPEHAVAEFTLWLRAENRLQSNKCLKVSENGPHTLKENIKEYVTAIGILDTNNYNVDEVDCPEGALS